MSPTTASPPLTRLGQLSAESLTQILRRRDDPLVSETEVVSLKTEPIGVGQIADSHRVTAQLDNGETLTLVAKSAAEDASARGAGQSLGLYRREVGFYRDLAAGLDVAAPQCLHNGFESTEAGQEDFLLLLEDLSPAAPIDQLAGCDVDLAGLVMDQAARLHAPRWADPALEQYEWLNISGTWNPMQASMYPDMFAGFCERYADHTNVGNFSPGTELVANLDGWYRLQSRPWTIQHGDFRLDNLLIDRGNARRPVNVVDWQTVMAAPGVVDIAYFLGTSISIEDRRIHERSLVERYHERLLASGVADYTWDECWTDYRRFAFAGYLMATSASMVAARTERGDRLFVAMLERSAAQIIDLNSSDLLKQA